MLWGEWPTADAQDLTSMICNYMCKYIPWVTMSMPQIASLSTDLSGFNGFTICQILPDTFFFCCIQALFGMLLNMQLRGSLVSGWPSSDWPWAAWCRWPQFWKFPVGIGRHGDMWIFPSFSDWLMLCGKKYVEMGVSIVETLPYMREIRKFEWCFVFLKYSWEQETTTIRSVLGLCFQWTRIWFGMVGMH